jgi:hypothetical protein
MPGKYVCKEGGKEMKKILEIGKIFKARCPKCNCLFQYEKEDILDIAIDDSHLSKEERFLRGDFFKTL